MYKLFYNPSVVVSSLRPVLDLKSCIEGANNSDINHQAKLVRVNWMINHLRFNSIQKPLLIDGAFRVVTGDTRLMALQAYPKISHVPVLMTSSVAPWLGWTEIENKIQLGKLLHLDPNNIITNWDWHDKPLDWIEFAYSHTSNHMHDQTQRERMITNYLARYPDTIFSADWLKERIDWEHYDS